MIKNTVLLVSFFVCALSPWLKAQSFHAVTGYSNETSQPMSEGPNSVVEPGTSESLLQFIAQDSSQDLVRVPAPTIAQNFVFSAEQISTESTSQSSSSNASKTQSVMTKSPGGAMVRSLICPGWGQLYNESYWKSALFFGAAATVSGILLWNNSRYLDANTTYSTPGISALEKDQAYREREFYRDQRDVSGLWLLGIYALSAVDAYVGAHLFDFDVSDKGVSLLPVATPQSYALSAAWHF